jgi:hypothetical protein
MRVVDLWGTAHPEFRMVGFILRPSESRLGTSRDRHLVVGDSGNCRDVLESFEARGYPDDPLSVMGDLRWGTQRSYLEDELTSGTASTRIKVQRSSWASRPLDLRISFHKELFQLLGELIVGGLDQNGLVRENDHRNHDLPAVPLPHEVTRFVVFVDVDPRVRHTVLVEETSRSPSVRAPGCAVNDNSFVWGTRVNDPPA